MPRTDGERAPARVKIAPLPPAPFPRALPPPTTCLPGTPEKAALLVERHKKNYALWNPEDAGSDFSAAAMLVNLASRPNRRGAYQDPDDHTHGLPRYVSRQMWCGREFYRVRVPNKGRRVFGGLHATVDLAVAARDRLLRKLKQRTNDKDEAPLCPGHKTVRPNTENLSLLITFVGGTVGPHATEQSAGQWIGRRCS